MAEVNWKAIAAALTTEISAVSGVGTISSYMPIVPTEEEVRALLPRDSLNRLNYWVIRRSNFNINREGAHTSSQWWFHTMAIDGWVSTTDAGQSLESFQDLADSVALSISTNISLGLDGNASCQVGDIRVDPIDIVLFAGILCHHVLIQVEVRHLKIVRYT
jgi:hypothetical protein